MKHTILSPVLVLAISASTASSQITENDGDWGLQEVEMTNTPEAALMVRFGDIDNLGFGWPGDFDPFSGKSTPSHGFPWTAPADTDDGTDRIMVITSYKW